MKISISKLRNNFKHYLQLVQEGELLEVIDGRSKGKEGEIMAILVQEGRLRELKELNARLLKELEGREVKKEPTSIGEEVITGKCQKPFCKFEGELKYGQALGEWNDQLGEREMIKGYFCAKHLV